MTHVDPTASLDPVQVTQMAKARIHLRVYFKFLANPSQYLETVYVSGWQSSSTASSTNEPGPDLAGRFIYNSLSRKILTRHTRLSVKYRSKQGGASLSGPTISR